MLLLIFFVAVFLKIWLGKVRPVYFVIRSYCGRGVLYFSSYQANLRLPGTNVFSIIFHPDLRV
jgi:hypothetical protein